MELEVSEEYRRMGENVRFVFLIVFCLGIQAQLLEQINKHGSRITRKVSF